MSNMVKKLIAFVFVFILMSVTVFFSVTYFNSAAAQKLIDQYQPPLIQPMLEPKYDVIVIGGEPEGVAAAVAAARNGAKTLLVEERENLGGLMTFGMLNYIDIVNGIDNKNAIGGVFEEWHKMIGGGNVFDLELAKSAFLKLVQDEPNITLALQTDVKSIIKDEATVIGVTILNEHGISTVYGKKFIDATQDAEFAALAEAPYYFGGEDINLMDRKMAVTLMIHLKNVNWRGVRKTAKDGTFGFAEVSKERAWGFNDLHFKYVPIEENTRLRGLNVVRIPKNEEIFINALHIFNVNGLNELEKQEAIEKGIRETNNILDYLRREFHGFENAQIASYPTELYVRETRHIKSEYMLPMSDVWTHADHWDSIGFGGYPVDVQATSIHDYGYILSSPVQYAIPFRSLVPLEVENLLVVSRSAGYSSLAAGSARIIPTGMAAGQAGGVAATMAIENNITFRELSRSVALIEELRSILSSQKAKLDYFAIDYPYKDEWFDESIQFLMDYGLVSAGYGNDLLVDEPLNLLAFANIVINGLYRSDINLYEEFIGKLKQVYGIRNAGSQNVDRDTLAEYVITSFTNEHPADDPWQRAFDYGLVDEFIFNHIDHNRDITRAEAFYISEKVLKQLVK